MNKTTERYEKLMSLMKPCSKEVYFKDEVQEELLGLKRVIVNCTYNEQHAENMRLGLADVVRHLEEKNSERGNVADEYLERLAEETKRFDTMLGRESAGNAGEIQAFRSLETVKTSNVTFHNLELNVEENRGELDAVVVTSKAIFLIEVKNSGHDMVIDAKGNYFRARGYMTMDYNIGEKVNNKEFLLRNAVEERLKKLGKNVNIVNYVVFANSRINVTNRYKYLKTCFLSQLPHLIDEYEGPEIYTEDDMKEIQQSIKSAEHKEAYPLDMDVVQMKKDFAMTMALLEMPEIEEQVDLNYLKEEEIMDSKKQISKKEVVGLVGAVAALTAVITSVFAVYKSKNK